MLQFVVMQAGRLRDVLSTLSLDERGQDMIEYALLAALISIVAVIVILALGPFIQNAYQDVANTLAST
jgi:pilus assembly protein Flp/PilA